MKREWGMQRERGEKSMYMQRNRAWWDTFVIQVNVWERSIGGKNQVSGVRVIWAFGEREKGGKEKIMQLIPVWFHFVSFICYPECLREAWLVSITWAKKYRDLCRMKHLSFSLLCLHKKVRVSYSGGEPFKAHLILEWKLVSTYLSLHTSGNRCVMCSRPKLTVCLHVCIWEPQACGVWVRTP